MANWYYPNAFRCDVHQVYGVKYPFPHFCQDCLDMRLRQEFEALTPELDEQEREPLYLEALFMGVCASRPQLWFYPLPLTPGREAQRSYLESEGRHLVDAIQRTVMKVVPMQRS